MGQILARRLASLRARLRAALRSSAIAIGLAMAGTALAQAREDARPLPSFAELEASGAKIGQVILRNRNIFDTDDPEEDYTLFRAANFLHIKTRESVIRKALLFKSGDRLQAPLIEETERILRTIRAFYEVSLRPVAVRDGVVDIEVMTRDAWSLDPGISYSRSGGANSTKINIREYNLLGTGASLIFGRTSTVDRSGNEFEFANDRAFDGWTRLSYVRARNDDGSSEGASIIRPFYALDARWAAGASWLRDDRIEAIYNAGEVAGEYRYKERRAELFGGWSRGRVDGWVRRYSLGVRLQDDAYSPEPGRIAPAALPANEKLVYPFVRLETVEERFERKENRNQLRRPEFFALGLASTLEVGHAGTGLGSSRDAWLYSGSLGRGFEFGADQTLLASAYISGRYADGRAERQQFGSRAQYYLPHHRRWLFYASAGGDVLTHPAPTESLLLGGESGLRGYPLRYQGGDRRALFTVEERLYTDVYVWRLFRLGAAAFADVGRAWGGPNENKLKPGWLANVGFGLRIFNTRSAFSNVMHLDVAVPLDPDVNVKRVQFLVKTRTSF